MTYPIHPIYRQMKTRLLLLVAATATLLLGACRASRTTPQPSTQPAVTDVSRLYKTLVDNAASWDDVTVPVRLELKSPASVSVSGRARMVRGQSVNISLRVLGMDALDDIFLLMEQAKELDIRGDVYEYLLSKIAQSGLNGQFRTPRHIIRMMVELMKPSADDMICDPACGTSGFLVAAGEYLKERRKEEIFYDKEKRDHYMSGMFHGYDMDRTMLRIGAMNMMTHGVENPFIEYRDSLSEQNADKDKYSLILANPPFKGSLDAEAVSGDLLKVCKTKKTELLFLALFVRMMKVGGRCACIVPDGVLFGSSKAHKDIRRELLENQRLEAVISMPSGVFKPYAGVSTGILIFTKTNHGGTDQVWFYDMQADGFSLDDKRSPVNENDIPDIIERFHNREGEKGRERTEKSFFVSKQEIVDNEYDLSVNKYKRMEYVPVVYPPTEEILGQIFELDRQIGVELEELKEMLAEP